MLTAILSTTSSHESRRTKVLPGPFWTVPTVGLAERLWLAKSSDMLWRERAVSAIQDILVAVEQPGDP